MKVAVVGAGLAGLATAWNLSQKNIHVTVFRSKRGASHASTGLLHRFVGKKAIESPRAKEGLKAALELLETASRKRPVFEQSGILRFAMNDEQGERFGGKTIWMPDGITVYSSLYLQELEKLMPNVQFIETMIGSLDELETFDRIVVTAGVGSNSLTNLSTKRTIGQALVCRTKQRIPHAFLGSGHISPTEDPDYCLVGSTYEHTEEPSLEKAMGLLEKVSAFYPDAKNFEVVEVRSGIRSAPKIGVMPILKKWGAKTWVFTGLGSRGLLYHALYAKELVEQLLLEPKRINMV